MSPISAGAGPLRAAGTPGLTGLFHAVAYLDFLKPTVAAALGPSGTTGQVFPGLTVVAVACTTMGGR